MKSLLISQTTREEREQIVRESVEEAQGACEECSPGMIEMYQDYIDGKKELREINLAFRCGYTHGTQGAEHGSCMEGMCQ